MIFPGFPGVLSFYQVFQVEWEPCLRVEEAFKMKMASYVYFCHVKD